MTLPSDIPEDIADRAAILMDAYRGIANDLEFTARIIMAVEAGEGIDKPLAMTKRQVEVLTFLQGCDWTTGVGPSVEEIRQGLAYSSKSKVARILNGLERRGHIRRLPGCARSITLIERAA